jgi:predicted AAA+ superfamily ATPase
MNRDIQTILMRDNPWLEDRARLEDWLSARLPEIYIPRQTVKRARKRWSEPDRAHLVIGPRQAGKSTTIWRHLADEGQPVLFIDCEQSLVREWCQSAPLFLGDLDGLLTSRAALFFEEVQHLEDAGLLLKGLVDRRPGVPILVTGSSSFHLRSRTRESLAGRASRTRLFPFTFAEVLWDLSGEPELLRNRHTDERFHRHLVFGGYPAVWLSEDPEIVLTDLVEAIILRDASDLFRIDRPDAFRRLLRLAATQVGSLINLSEWASIVGISRDTVASYIEILESSHVVKAVPPFAGGRRSELTRTPKIFLVDNGVRNRLLHDFKPLEERIDKGAMFENWVFTELWKQMPDGATLHFWRSTSGAEVDFVIARGETLVGVEVKTASLRRRPLPRATRSFLQAYSPQELLVVNTGYAAEERIANTDVRWIEPIQLADSLHQAFG